MGPFCFCYTRGTVSSNKDIGTLVRDESQNLGDVCGDIAVLGEELLISCMIATCEFALVNHPFLDQMHFAIY
jgi:hypothetical protein